MTSPSTSHIVRPGLLWPDDRGAHIQAHGGGVIRVDGVWYWFGEDRSRENDPGRRFVACYASRDLARWEFRGQVLALADPENFGPEWVLERPKVYPSETTGRFVMYFHVDGRLTPDDPHAYSIAAVGVATCDTVDGSYRFERHFRPLDRESRDIGQFIDDDGAAYLIFECRPDHGFYIVRLTADRLNVEREVTFIRSPLEGGAIVKHDGLYYVIGSHLTGWWPNANQYAIAPRLEGPWSEFRDFAPPHTHTWGSQSTNLIKVVGSRRTTVVYAGDRWRPDEQWDSRYLWMPLEIGDGRLTLPEPRPWSMDVRTGELTFH